MNDNVGDMPIEIFGDYVSDTLGIEYDWIYCIPILNIYGCSYQLEMPDVLMMKYINGHGLPKYSDHTRKAVGSGANTFFGMGMTSPTYYGEGLCNSVGFGNLRGDGFDHKGNG